MKNAYVLLAFSSLLLVGLILGCSGSQTEESDEIIPPAEPIFFTAPETLMNATVGTEYVYSFCEPESALFSGTCGDGNETVPTNPQGGNPQYGFSSLDGIIPAGLMLRTNGMLTGTPTDSGEYNFSVCITDLREVFCKNISLTVLPALEIYDAKILDMSCKWRTETGNYNIVNDIVRIIARGTAQGPVGARLELPILAWSDDDVDCGDWTHHSGALIAVGDTCRREAGDPERTNWTVDTGEHSPTKSYWYSSMSYSVKIYADDDIYFKTDDSKSAKCED